eukprot:CAMPEP_0197897012 /NCGR_PEP_ID=MMETSP1439-20131203/41436_1 /TAXON_ID=66791 /ORGANISM="Gonyaulax spinifera, Strain CCMP409" /LENGTH=155 /DNA_ID=CAMNT_0043517603 /DNA_START=78 /DNA_END=545 /DNA_ORIENTATION=+
MEHTAYKRTEGYGPDHFTLRIRSPSGMAVEIQVCPRTKVKEVKEMLEAAEGTFICEQRLICNGSVMNDDRSLASYRLRDGSVVVHTPLLKATMPHSRTTFPKHERAPHVSRGMLMVPGYGAPWTPEVAGRVSQEEYEGHFDSSKLPPPWKISTLA